MIGIRIRANEWDRALVISALMWIAFFRLGGRLWELSETFARGLAILLALVVVTVGVNYSTTTASGSDSYGYASEAELMLSGTLRVTQPWVRAVPWPEPDLTFSPLGYRPVALPVKSEKVLVPTYPPGLPLLMAAGKLFGGQEGLFWIVPLSGGILVLTAYLLGAVLATPAAGLIGAWLVASSPAMLMPLISPMSDVPAARRSAWRCTW